MKTYNELIEIAKQKKVKHYRRYRKHKLEKIFEFEAKDPTAFYEKYCKEKWKITPVIATNSEGKEIKFQSLYAAGKHFHLPPQSIKWRILEKNRLKLNNVMWSFFYQKN